MLKILQVDSYSGIGGGEMVMFNIVNGLKGDFNFVIAAPEGEFLKKYQQMSLKFFRLKRQSAIKSILKIRKIIKQENPRIIHCHGTRVAFWSRLAVLGLKNKPKIVYTLHGFHIIRKPILVRWLLVSTEKFLNHWTDILVCVSEADKKIVLKYKTISADKIVVIKNGIDIEKFKVNPDSIKKIKEGLNLIGKFILLSIGRLHPQKDFFTLLEAIEQIKKNYHNSWTNIILLIAGNGHMEKELKKKAKELDVYSQVYFLGFRNNIPELINSSDIVILSSNWEGLPLTTIEAGASGKPVIASDIDGIRETIVDNQTGFLFKPHSAQDLAKKIIELYQDDNLRKNMGENAFNFVANNFSKEKMVEKYKLLYNRYAN